MWLHLSLMSLTSFSTISRISYPRSCFLKIHAPWLFVPILIFIFHLQKQKR
uniref:Transmembrane protein n=1 Tax=Medicago truncatula TaxID=3880 RepID=I3SEW6_MEDTR|nr:unknown [Medicago truncatula]